MVLATLNPNQVTGNKLPDEVTRLIQSSVPTIDALEILLFLVRGKGAHYSPEEMVNALGDAAPAVPLVRQYLAMLRAQGVVAELQGARYAYRPQSAEIELAIGSLVTAYNERPVTLIRTVYHVADSKNIQHFADAFGVKKSP